MKSKLAALVVIITLASSMAWAQKPCPCSPRSATVIRPYYPIYFPQPLGCRVGRQQLGCYAQDSTAGGVPLTLRNMVRTLDALIPCGPRSGHGCGFACIGAGSGCLGLSCHRDIAYCPLCGAPPFACTCYCGGCVDSPPSRPWIQEPTFEDEAANGNGPRESKTDGQ